MVSRQPNYASPYDIGLKWTLTNIWIHYDKLVWYGVLHRQWNAAPPVHLAPFWCLDKIYHETLLISIYSLHIIPISSFPNAWIIGVRYSPSSYVKIYVEYTRLILPDSFPKIFFGFYEKNVFMLLDSYQFSSKSVHNWMC